MLEARGLTKRYDGLLAVDHVSFAVRRGEIVVLARGSVQHPSDAGYVTVILGIPIVTLRSRRLRHWSQLPLLFEDQFPDRIEKLFNS